MGEGEVQGEAGGEWGAGGGGGGVRARPRMGGKQCECGPLRA